MVELNSIQVPGGEAVFGIKIDSQTRCSHYRSALDVVAIKFRCCGNFYSCYECHAEIADHPADKWSIENLEARAILCGVCGATISISDYLDFGTSCGSCGAPFNPGCRLHRHLYFDF